MKQYIFLLILICLVNLISCEEYLDKSPDLGLTEEEVFNNFFTVRGYLDRCYNCVVDYTFWRANGLERSHIGQFSDEGANPYNTNKLATVVNTGKWLTDKQAPDVGWGEDFLGTPRANAIPNAFHALRIANKVIEKAPLMVNLTQSERNQLLGQAHFFRAWFYFEIIRRVGGMQLLDKPFLSDDEFDVPRLTYHQSTDWIVEQLNIALTYLPDEWPAQELGRPNKAAAYALKSMAELYAASPLMCNPIDKIENNGYDSERAKKGNACILLDL